MAIILCHMNIENPVLIDKYLRWVQSLKLTLSATVRIFSFRVLWSILREPVSIPVTQSLYILLGICSDKMTQTIIESSKNLAIESTDKGSCKYSVPYL